VKIFAAGIATESNTFSPLLTKLEDFLIVRGQDVAERRVPYPNLDLSATWGRQAQARGDAFIFSLMAWAEPAGVTLCSAYETLRDEVLRDLEMAGPVDVVLLNLHGAMVAEEYEDCEADIVRRVRAIVGRDTVIGVELDLHCHLSEAKLQAADLIITYKEYPHTDTIERGRELFELAVATRLGRIRPTMALFDCRMIGLYPTSREPMRCFVDEMIKREGLGGVLSISFGHGFQFADVPHLSAKVLVITDNDRALAVRVAQEMGMRVYKLRREIGCESFSLPMEQAFGEALASPKVPIVIADQSDNTGTGAPGDSTFALRWLLDQRIENAAVALIYDPEVVKAVMRAGPGATLPLKLGGKLGSSSGLPVDVTATVLSIHEHYMQEFPQQNGQPELVYSGDIVAIRCEGIDIVVTNARCQCFSPGVFSDLGIDPKEKRLLVVKSTQHFYAAFAPISGGVIYMSAPGAAAADPRRLRYQLVDTQSLYPWIENPLDI
jgi:microcystin degradation protein MlrC